MISRIVDFINDMARPEFHYTSYDITDKDILYEDKSTL